MIIQVHYDTYYDMQRKACKTTQSVGELNLYGKYIDNTFAVFANFYSKGWSYFCKLKLTRACNGVNNFFKVGLIHKKLAEGIRQKKFKYKLTNVNLNFFSIVPISWKDLELFLIYLEHCCIGNNRNELIITNKYRLMILHYGVSLL